MLDIMRAGGFCSHLSGRANGHFQNGTECVMYNSLEDAIAKCSIISCTGRRGDCGGRSREERSFRYEDRIKTMFSGLEI